MIIRYISYLLYVLIVGAGLVLILEKRERPEAVNTWISPCSEPVTYYIAGIDDRFALNHNELRRLLIRTENLWSVATSRQLFRYDPNGDVAIYLVYDERQELIEREREFAGMIHLERTRFNRMTREYRRHEELYNDLMASYQSALREYQEKISAHNHEVSGWNERGGAPEAEKERIEGREAELNRLQTDLLSRQNRVNQAAAALESVIGRLHETEEEKNSMIGEYNEQFTGEYQWSQGEYVRRDDERRINIFHYKSLNHLQLVLAHEFGHALGLGHGENPRSVMYPVLETFDESVVRLSEEDLASVQAHCN